MAKRTALSRPKADPEPPTNPTDQGRGGVSLSSEKSDGGPESDLTNTAETVEYEPKTTGISDGNRSLRARAHQRVDELFDLAEGHGLFGEIGVIIPFQKGIAHRVVRKFEGSDKG